MDKKYVTVAYIVTFLLFAFAGILRADELNQASIEIVWKDSMKSNHANNCDPWCANEENGGNGMIVHYKRLDKYINIAAGHIELINSYGNPGSVTFFQPHAMDFEYVLFDAVSLFAEAAIWFMEIKGYTKESCPEYYTNSNGNQACVERQQDPTTVHTPPWPVFRFGMNPIYKLTKDFRLDWRLVKFPIVDISFVTITYRTRF